MCLQAEFSLHTPENAWRAGQGLRPYIKDAQRILIRARETNSQRIKQAREGRGWVGAGWAGAPRQVVEDDGMELLPSPGHQLGAGHSRRVEQWGGPAPASIPSSQPHLAALPPQDKLDFLHLPVLDGNVTSDAAMSRLADDCCARILRGERMYIHWCGAAFNLSWVLAGWPRLGCNCCEQGLG